MIKKAPKLYTPCCGVFAAFLAHPAEEFEPVMLESRKKLGKASHWQGRMTWMELVSLLDNFNIQHRRVPEVAGLTVGRAIKDGHFIPDCQYVIFISGHFFTLRTGLVYDQFYPEGIEWNKRGVARCKIKAIVRIL